MERSLDNYQPQPLCIKEGRMRKIYSRVPLEPEEEKAMVTFNEYSSNNAVEVPEWVNGDSRYALKFMDSVKRDPKKAVEMMKTYCAWLLTLPIPEDRVIGHLRNGLIYISGRSLLFNPIMVVNVRKIIESKIDLDDLLMVNYFLFNWVIDNMLVPGKVETWIIIQDIKDVGVTSVPVKLLKTMSERLSVYYTMRLSKCFTINVPMMINALWGMVKVFIDEETRKKIFIQRKGWEKMLAEIITPDNLEQKYGGSLPNREVFYPFN